MGKKKRGLVQLGGSKTPVAFCLHPIHRFTLSEQQMKTKGCLGKQCPHLKKLENNPYWEERERRKLEAKENKKFKKDFINSKALVKKSGSELSVATANITKSKLDNWYANIAQEEYNETN